MYRRRGRVCEINRRHASKSPAKAPLAGRIGALVACARHRAEMMTVGIYGHGRKIYHD